MLHTLRFTRKAAAWLILICLCLAVSGCWDRRELQERNFVLGIGIDYADVPQDKQQAEQRRVLSFYQPNGQKRYEMSLQILNLSPSGGSGEGGTGGGGSKGGGKTYVISNTGQSLFEMVRDMAGQVARSLWFEHIQTVVINEDVLKQDGLLPIVDFMRRDSEMRSRIRVLATPNKAKDILSYQPPNQEAGAIHLSGILRNHIKNTHVISAQSDFGYLMQYLANNKDMMIPRVELAGSKLKVGGAAIIRKNNMVGTFDEYAVKGARYLRTTVKSDVITVNCPEHPENIFVFEVFRYDAQLTPHRDNNGTLYYTFDIYLLGNIGELQICPGGHDLNNVQFIRLLETTFAEAVKSNIEYTVREAQQLGTDVLGFDTKLKGTYPEMWEQVKDHWDEIFSSIPVHISVNVTIRGTGERS